MALSCDDVSLFGNVMVILGEERNAGLRRFVP
jgi:hypothetical protein